jgi:hypothetical protein
MAGVDIFLLFPNSYMAGAVRAGLSRFRSIEGLEIPATLNESATEANVNTGTQIAIPGGSVGTALSAGVFTLNTAGAKTTATLLAAAGLTTNFTTISFAVTTAPAGVTIARGAGSAVYAQGSSVSFTNASVATNPVTITLASGDVVQVLYSGT